jgi:hypothetical protein
MPEAALRIDETHNHWPQSVIGTIDVQVSRSVALMVEEQVVFDPGVDASHALALGHAVDGKRG